MKLILVSMTIAVFSMSAFSLQKTNDNQSGNNWIALFNGNDLTGWTSHGEIDAWGVRDGELVTLKPGKGRWIRTEKMYRDFELKLDFWMPKGGNSGVGIRGSSNGNPAFSGFEIQILDTYGEEPANHTYPKWFAPLQS